MSLGKGLAAVASGGQIFAGMDANVLFGKALGLGSGWKVVKSEMDVAGRELKIWLDFESGSQFACPQCGAFCPVHDTVEKKWRHLDFWQHRTELIARVPRTHCQEHGILQAAVPWARPGSGFTLMMEAMILLLGQQMSVSAAARHLGESDKRLWRVLEHYVMEAHLAKDWSQLRRLMIDETSARKGHRYVTVVLDAESHDLLFMVEGRSAQAITEFLAAMPAHGAKAEAITEVVMDMSPAYIAGVQTHFPNARIVFDLFHIMKLAGEALDAVRKSLRKQGADLTGGLGLSEAMNGRAPRSNSSCAANWHALTRSWAAPSPCARPSKACWPMGTFLPSAGGWAGPTAPGSNLSANSPELSKNTSTASWPIFKPA